MNALRTLRGACACGAVSFQLIHPDDDVIVCHCRTCRRWSGHVWAAVYVDAPGLVLEADTTLQWWASSTIAERGFCSRCGSSLFYRRHDSERISVAPGALDRPTGLTTAAHICCEEAGDYDAFDDSVPSFSGPAIGAGK